LTQDTFVDFLEALRDFRYQSSLKTFIFSIAKNKNIDWLRKKKIKKIIFSYAA
jgi:RNA polymerase sigma-70 factor (ECF subfamily)